MLLEDKTSHAAAPLKDAGSLLRGTDGPLQQTEAPVSSVAGSGQHILAGVPTAPLLEKPGQGTAPQALAASEFKFCVVFPAGFAFEDRLAENAG